MGSARALLEVKNLKTFFFTDEGTAKAVDDVSYTIPEGKILGVVGESGCGKSVSALSIMRLIPDPPGQIVAGEIKFDGKDLLTLSEPQMRTIRGNDISMIFQEPMTSLNPVFTIGDQIMEAILLHQKTGKTKAREIAIDMLDKVGIPSPSARIDEYPHQMSGGMRQRVMIAMALSCNPRLLIADEPTTALDVTIQAQILDLIRGLQRDIGLSVLLITHDLGVIAEMADEVVVMYAGKVVESGDVRTVFKKHVHPYTEGLFHSLPSIGKPHERLHAIEGNVPTPYNFPSGCRFRDRCPIVEARCASEEPPLLSHGGGQMVACHFKVPTGVTSRREIQGEV